MSSVVLILALIVVIAISTAESKSHEKQLHGPSMPPFDIRAPASLKNKVHQKDAITFELGTPSYEILNPDEKPVIITQNQPHYYESLRRFSHFPKRKSRLQYARLGSMQQRNLTKIERNPVQRQNIGTSTFGRSKPKTENDADSSLQQVLNTNGRFLGRYGRYIAHQLNTSKDHIIDDTKTSSQKEDFDNTHSATTKLNNTGNMISKFESYEEVDEEEEEEESFQNKTEPKIHNPNESFNDTKDNQAGYLKPFLNYVQLHAGNGSYLESLTQKIKTQSISAKTPEGETETLQQPKIREHFLSVDQQSAAKDAQNDAVTTKFQNLSAADAVKKITEIQPKDTEILKPYDFATVRVFSNNSEHESTTKQNGMLNSDTDAEGHGQDESKFKHSLAEKESRYKILIPKSQPKLKTENKNSKNLQKGKEAEDFYSHFEELKPETVKHQSTTADIPKTLENDQLNLEQLLTSTFQENSTAGSTQVEVLIPQQAPKIITEDHSKNTEHHEYYDNVLKLDLGSFGEINTKIPQLQAASEKDEEIASSKYLENLNGDVEFLREIEKPNLNTESSTELPKTLGTHQLDLEQLLTTKFQENSTAGSAAVEVLVPQQAPTVISGEQVKNNEDHEYYEDLLKQNFGSFSEKLNTKTSAEVLKIPAENEMSLETGKSQVEVLIPEQKPTFLNENSSKDLKYYEQLLKENQLLLNEKRTKQPHKQITLQKEADILEDGLFKNSESLKANDKFSENRKEQTKNLDKSDAKSSEFEVLVSQKEPTIIMENQFDSYKNPTFYEELLNKNYKSLKQGGSKLTPTQNINNSDGANGESQVASINAELGTKTGKYSSFEKPTAGKEPTLLEIFEQSTKNKLTSAGTSVSATKVEDDLKTEPNKEENVKFVFVHPIYSKDLNSPAHIQQKHFGNIFQNLHNYINDLPTSSVPELRTTQFRRPPVSEYPMMGPHPFQGPYLSYPEISPLPQRFQPHPLFTTNLHRNPNQFFRSYQPPHMRDFGHLYRSAFKRSTLQNEKKET